MTFQASHTRLTTASPESVWTRWTTAADWAPDDPGTEWAVFDGQVAAGETGHVKSAGSPAQRFTFTRVEHHAAMDLAIALPGGRLEILHSLAETPAGLSVTHGLLITGPLSGLYAAVVGRALARELPEVVRLVTLHALRA
ncbi:hypothetical protein GCM10025867_42290 [Frondihabitans sucicola]|uniref:SRPBCC family protein n=1 Tax=Frondihabitans sucicola TaxID=1268041 RepID=A0ABM8GU81_9MICO|nr:hypothetical protein [Frondihabitans sucicola]BDZ51988.1 hypothetical protein GCM10025867_42290 [Frondihabitans sucicola]